VRARVRARRALLRARAPAFLAISSVYEDFTVGTSRLRTTSAERVATACRRDTYAAMTARAGVARVVFFVGGAPAPARARAWQKVTPRRARFLWTLRAPRCVAAAM
jgi:hypothetical protein